MTRNVRISLQALSCISIILTLALFHCYFSSREYSRHSPVGSSMNSSSVTLLLVSDIHRCIENLEGLKSFLDARHIFPSHVLCPGDFHMLWEEDQNNKDKVQQAINEIQSLLNALLKISPNVYYIPGNHDPITMFLSPSAAHGAKDLQISSQAVSAQKRMVEISRGLYVAGFGGAPPGYRQGEEVWSGYPYHTQQAFQEEYDSFLDNIHIDQRGKKSVILMTHAGPNFCSSTRDFSEVDRPPITSGVDSVYASLAKKVLQEKVITLVHGHTHYAQGCEWIGTIRVVNPGSMSASFGDFAIMTLKEENSNTNWVVDNITFYNIH